jgi:molybdenum cofactor cytidylyltransferase
MAPSGKKPTAGIILAAGRSIRFGRPKQLLNLAGKQMLEWVLDAALDSQLARVNLVLGYKHREVLKRLARKVKHPRVTVTINRKYQKGQSTSLRAGIAQIRDKFPSAMFFLGDQPLVDPKTIDFLLERFWSSEKNICVPYYNKTRGNPVILSSTFFDAISRLKGDIGARKIIQDNPDQVLKVALERATFFHDIDDEKDYQYAQSFFKTATEYDTTKKPVRES